MTEQVVCTIVTKNYLPLARTLASTLAEHNPNSTLFVLLADRVDGYFDPSVEPFNLIRIEDLPDQELIDKMCFYYNAFELCNALRPFLHEYIMRHLPVESWLYLDSDIMICSSLAKIFQTLKSTSILLTPHRTTPINIKDVVPHELHLLRGGLYNSGFLGLRRTDETKAFISWFKERLILFSFNDTCNPKFFWRGLFVDQLWLNLVPFYFKDVSWYLDPGANLGHWNLFERKLEKNDYGEITVNGQPLLFIHFSGWDISNTYNISKHAPMYEGKIFPIWIELANKYREKLLFNGYEKLINLPYAFNHFQNLEPITSDMRHMYYEALNNGVAFEGSPFAHFSYFKSSLYSGESKGVESKGVKIGFLRRGKRIARTVVNFFKFPLLSILKKWSFYN